jgi:hypothetical protein
MFRLSIIISGPLGADPLFPFNSVIWQLSSLKQKREAKIQIREQLPAKLIEKRPSGTFYCTYRTDIFGYCIQ